MGCDEAVVLGDAVGVAGAFVVGDAVGVAEAVGLLLAVGTELGDAVGLAGTLGASGGLEGVRLSGATVGLALGTDEDDATTGVVMGFRAVVALLVQPASMVVRTTMPAIPVPLIPLEESIIVPSPPSVLV